MNVIHYSVKRSKGSFDRFYLLYEESGDYYMVEIILEKYGKPFMGTWKNQWDSYPPFTPDVTGEPGFISMSNRLTWNRHLVTGVVQTGQPKLQAFELFDLPNPLNAYLDIWNYKLTYPFPVIVTYANGYSQQYMSEHELPIVVNTVVENGVDVNNVFPISIEYGTSNFSVMLPNTLPYVFTPPGVKPTIPAPLDDFEITPEVLSLIESAI